MASFRDLTRLLNGLSLIANEFAKRSLPATTSDFETLIKKTLVSATDLSGITKGKVRHFPDTPPSSTATRRHDAAASSSVVFFADDNPSSQSHSTPATTTVTNIDDVAYSSSDANHRQASDANVCAAEEEKSGVVTSAETVNQGASRELAPAPEPPPSPLRKRRPRERKVPATPFSRALGSVLFYFIEISSL